MFHILAQCFEVVIEFALYAVNSLVQANDGPFKQTL